MRKKTFLLLLGLFIPLLGCEFGELAAVPAGWLGEWRTDALKFEGFTFRITGETLVFLEKKAETQTKTYPISWVQKHKEDANLFTIHYVTNEGLKFQFTFYYDPSAGGSITLKNQRKHVWKKIAL